MHMQKVKVKGHSVKNLDERTDGQTEAIALPSVLMRGNYFRSFTFSRSILIAYVRL